VLTRRSSTPYLMLVESGSLDARLPFGYWNTRLGCQRLNGHLTWDIIAGLGTRCHLPVTEQCLVCPGEDTILVNHTVFFSYSACHMILPSSSATFHGKVASSCYWLILSVFLFISIVIIYVQLSFLAHKGFLLMSLVTCNSTCTTVLLMFHRANNRD
jgi:hypothetical protein